nr:hypothetical protein [Leptospira perolatii]
MLYIAIALILVGILCFIYVSFQQNPGKKSSPSTVFRQNESYSQRPRERVPVTEYISHKRIPRSEEYSHLEERFAEERRIRPGFQNRVSEQEIPEMSPPAFDSFPPRTETVERPTRKEESFQNETFEDFEETIETWRMEGILFLDLSGKLPYRELQNKISQDSLKGFRRMGRGIIREIPGGFSFKAMNSEFRYNLSEIEKVIFYDQGFALLPIKREFPVPVFVTSEPERFKEYLEQAKG